MPAETDKFIVATFALWAGDFEYFEQLVREFSPPNRVAAIEKGAKTPEDFIRATGVLRLRQLWQKRGEFKKLAREYRDPSVAVTHKALILETTHLRGTLWRTGEREFQMQGYLKELGWQKGLFERAHTEAAGRDTSRVEPQRPVVETLESRVEGDLSRPLGVAWTVPGNPFLQVELTDMGLIEAIGWWTKPRLPQSADAITVAFEKLLNGLDETTQAVD